MPDKPIVRICSWCQQINKPSMAEQAATIPQKIRDEMKLVDKRIREDHNKFMFTHGVCIPHVTQTYKTLPGMTEEKLKGIINKVQQSDPPPCLVQDTPQMQLLRDAYAEGFFSDELVKQYQTGDNYIVERFKKLAGIPL